MNEKDLRQTVLALAGRYLGAKTDDQAQHILIDAYNSFFVGHYPRGYKLKYTDAWCQPFVEAIAIMSNLADLFPAECGCQEALNLAKQAGTYRDLTYTPQPADVIYFDRNPDGWSDHTGFVKEVKDGKIYTIEGNAQGDECRENVYDKTDVIICGYVAPDYASKVTDGFPWTGTVQTSVNLRTSPVNLGPMNYCNVESPEGSPIRHVLLKGETVKVIGEHGNWWNVEVTGRYTWKPWCAKYDSGKDIIKG